MNLPQRRHPRLKQYDYSQEGSYFITICVKNREWILSNITECRDNPYSCVVLKEHGRVVQKYIENISSVYNDVFVDHYIIMPDHIHLLVRIGLNGGVKAPRPTTHTIVRSLKTMVTKELGYSIWQTSYYEHIIRNEQEYEQIIQYIDENPTRWREKT